jgi:molybdenum cofactor biosynthesis enzyme MoaA
MKNIYRLLRLNRALGSERAIYAAAATAHTMRLRHLVLRFDPVLACNLRCTMCYFSDPEYVRANKGRFTMQEVERIADLMFPRALMVVFGCGTEPTMWKDWPELVRIAKDRGVPNVGMTTNAQLITSDQIEKLIDYGLDEITISLHGVRRETYNRFMVKSDFDTLHRVLRDLNAAKTRRGVSRPGLRINYTVNSDNMQELTEFYEAFGDYRPAVLQIRPVMDIEGEYRTMLSAADITRFNEIAGLLREQSAARGVTYLVNTLDPTYVKQGAGGLALKSAYRYINPKTVWRDDFDWRNETYDAFCKRIGWTRELVRSAIDPGRGEKSTLLIDKYSTRYDVTM